MVTSVVVLNKVCVRHYYKRDLWMFTISDCQALEVFKREKGYFTTGPGLSIVTC